MCIEKCNSIELLRCEHEGVYDVNYGRDQDAADVVNANDWRTARYRTLDASVDDVRTASKWQRRGKKLVVASALLTGSLGLVGASQAAAAPCVDSDGDGWGWDEDTKTSCKMDGGSANENNDDDANQDDPSPSSNQSESAADQDYDWDAPPPSIIDDTVDNVEATEPGGETESMPATRSQCVDSDGDGWGWIKQTRESCEMPTSQQNQDYVPEVDEPAATASEVGAPPVADAPEVDTASQRCREHGGDWVGGEDSGSCEICSDVPPGGIPADLGPGEWAYWACYPMNENTGQIYYHGLVRSGGESSTDRTTPQQPTQHEATPACVDSDGDGWGWIEETRESCEMPASQQYLGSYFSPSDEAAESEPKISNSVAEAGSLGSYLEQIIGASNAASPAETPSSSSQSSNWQENSRSGSDSSTVDSMAFSYFGPSSTEEAPTGQTSSVVSDQPGALELVGDSFEDIFNPGSQIVVIPAQYTPEDATPAISSDNALEIVRAMDERHQQEDVEASAAINAMPRTTMYEADEQLRAGTQYNLDQANEQIATYSQAEAALRAAGRDAEADEIAARLAEAQEMAANSHETLYPTDFSEALSAQLFGGRLSLAQVSLLLREGALLPGQYLPIMPGSDSPTEDQTGDPISTGQQAANIYNGGLNTAGGEFGGTPVVTPTPPPVATPTPPPVREHTSLADENAANNNINNNHSAQDVADEYAGGNNETGEFG